MKNTTTFPTRFALLLLPLSLACGDARGGGPSQEDAAAPTEPARVWFVSPVEGEEVMGPDVLVQLGSSGVRITPASVHEDGTGHHHIFLNTDLIPLGDTIPAGVTGILHMGQGQTELLLQDLPPGEHRLIAVIGEWSHVPLNPAAVDTLHFTVVAPQAVDLGRPPNP